jgi:hypothetical protein
MPLTPDRASLRRAVEAAYIDQSQAGTTLFGAASLRNPAGFG